MRFDCHGVRGLLGWRFPVGLEMKLLDARKFAVKQQSRVRFRLSNGMDCVITENGVSRVPDLKSVPEFDLEDEFARAVGFVVEPASAKDKAKSRAISREELETLVGGAAGGKIHEEHEE